MNHSIKFSILKIIWGGSICLFFVSCGTGQSNIEESLSEVAGSTATSIPVQTEDDSSTTVAVEEPLDEVATAVQQEIATPLVTETRGPAVETDSLIDAPIDTFSASDIFTEIPEGIEENIYSQISFGTGGGGDLWECAFNSENEADAEYAEYLGYIASDSGRILDFDDVITWMTEIELRVCTQNADDISIKFINPSQKMIQLNEGNQNIDGGLKIDVEYEDHWVIVSFNFPNGAELGMYLFEFEGLQSDIDNFISFDLQESIPKVRYDSDHQLLTLLGFEPNEEVTLILYRYSSSATNMKDNQIEGKIQASNVFSVNDKGYLTINLDLGEDPNFEYLRSFAVATLGSTSAGFLTYFGQQEEGSYYHQTSVLPSSLDVNTEPFICNGAPYTRIRLGDRVAVMEGTGDASIRDLPASGTVYDKFPEGSIFEVIGGPNCSNQIVWWEVRTGNGLVGWTAEGKNEEYWLRSAD